MKLAMSSKINTSSLKPYIARCKMNVKYIVFCVILFLFRKKKFAVLCLLYVKIAKVKAKAKAAQLASWLGDAIIGFGRAPAMLL